MPTLNDKFYREIRCTNCRKLFGYEYIFAGRIAFSCPRCGELNEFEFKHIKSNENMSIIDKEFTAENAEDLKGGEK